MQHKDNRHIIKKQVLQLEVSNRNNAEKAQQELGQIFYSALLPIILENLDKYSPPNVIHRIERLEIDLGEISRQNIRIELERELSTHFEKQLVKALQKAELLTAIKAEAVHKGIDSAAVSKSSEASNSFSAKNATRPQDFQKVQSSTELFLHFLKNGYFPWWAKAANGLLERTLTELLQQSPPSLTISLGNLLQQQAYRQRLINALPDQTLIQLIPLLEPAGLRSKSLSFIQNLSEKTSSLANHLQIPVAQMKYMVWETILSSVLHKDQTVRLTHSIFTNLKQALFQAFQLKPEDIQIAWHKMGIQEDHPNTMVERAEESEQKSISQQSSTVTRKSHDNDQYLTTTFSNAFSSSDEIYIDNAGLVLLWIFLSNFYQHLGWLDGKVFRSIALQHRAVWMLQYLVDKTIQPKEFLLPLNKILCGVPVQVPLEALEPLNGQEQSACEELLEAVLAYASALGQISPEGFRQSFLQREGILSQGENRWLLQVQKETYDILLSRLDWSYQVVKLPWMNTAIFVEW